MTSFLPLNNNIIAEILKKVNYSVTSFQPAG